MKTLLLLLAAVTQCAALTCVSGKYWPLFGSCVDCPAGKYEASSTCLLCPAGQFQPAAAADSCTGCPAGKYQVHEGKAGCGACQACAGGHYKAGCGSYEAGSCIACDAGMYKTSNEAGPWDQACSECALGRFAGATGAIRCADCAAGQYAREGHTTCFHCQSGQYAPYVGSNECLSCAPGSWHADAGRTTCDHCPAGKYQQLEGKYFCTECAVNNFQPGVGTTSCMPCPFCEVTDLTGATFCRSDKTHCTLSAWSAWGACSASCHEGTNSRTRTVIEAARCGGDLCAVLAASMMCFERACDCAKVTCKYEHHDCTTYTDQYDAAPSYGSTYARVFANNKIANSAFRTHRDPADSEYSSKSGTSTMGGMGIGSHDGSTASVGDAHNAGGVCHNKTSVRVYHNSEERYFEQKGTTKHLQEGHHCHMTGGASGRCQCRCHKSFRHDYGYNPKHISKFNMACGVIHGLECDDSYMAFPTSYPTPYPTQYPTPYPTVVMPTAEETAAFTSSASTVVSLAGVTAQEFGSVPQQAVKEAVAAEFGVHASQVSLEVLTDRRLAEATEAAEAANRLRIKIRIRCAQWKALQVKAKMALLATSLALQALFTHLVNLFLAQHGTGLTISVVSATTPVLATGAPTAFPTPYATPYPTPFPTYYPTPYPTPSCAPGTYRVAHWSAAANGDNVCANCAGGKFSTAYNAADCVHCPSG